MNKRWLSGPVVITASEKAVLPTSGNEDWWGFLGGYSGFGDVILQCVLYNDSKHEIVLDKFRMNCPSIIKPSSDFTRFEEEFQSTSLDETLHGMNYNGNQEIEWLKLVSFCVRSYLNLI